MQKVRSKVGTRLLSFVAMAAVSSVALPVLAARSSSADVTVPNTWLALYSTPGDSLAPYTGSHLFVQSSTTHIYASAAGTKFGFSMTGDADNRFEFGSASGQALAVGYYGNADRLDFQRAGHPGMDISGNALGCNVISGDFAIEDIGFVNGKLDRLVVTFIQHCEGGVGAIFGEGSFNEPATGPLLLQATSLRVPPQYVGVGVNLPLWVTNAGNTPVPVGAPAVATPAGSSGGDVAVTADTCPSLLSVGGTCIVTVRISPTASGQRQSTITIPSGTSTQMVPVDDSGLAGDAAFTLDSEPGEYVGGGQQLTLNQFNAAVSAVDPIAFTNPGSVNLMATSGPSTSAVDNHTLQATLAAPTGQDLVIGAYQNALSGATASQPGLKITADGRTCATAPTTSPPLQSSGQFTVREIAFDSNGYLIRFAADAVLRCPAAGPPLYASFRVGSSVGYSAVAVQPVPGQLKFGLQLIGTTSAVRQVTVTNTGDQAQTVAPTVTGDAADFPLSSTCGPQHQLAPGSSCSLSVAFAPVGVEDRRAWLVISDGTRRGAHTFALDGGGASVPWLTYPYDGQNTVYTSHPFTWLTLPNAQANVLIVGTTDNKADLVNSGVLPGNQTSFRVSALPTNIGLYATVFSEINGHWQHSPTINFNLTPQVAKFTTPADGWSGFALVQTFTWINNVEAGGYVVIIGTKPGSQNLANSGLLASTEFAYFPPALATGVVLYATIFTEWAGHWDFANSISFSYKSGATFASPTSGQQTVSATAAYTWLPFAQAQAYCLVVSTTPGGADIINSGVLPATQTYYSGVALPKGVTLYATIFTEISGSWSNYQTITFESN